MPEAESRCVAVVIETEHGPVIVVIVWPQADGEAARPAPTSATEPSGGGWSLDLSDEP